MLPVYSPKDVVVSFLGIAITGFAPDSFIRMRRNSDLIKETVGAAGDLALTKVADRTGELEIELMQTSQSNLALSAQLLAIELGGDIIASQFMIQDPSGSVLALAVNAYPKSFPEIDLGADQNTRVWTFGCEVLEYSSIPPGIAQAIPTLAIPL